MNIIINEKEVSKVELLALIKKNKLKAIKSLRKFANIGLKDAVFIVENLKRILIILTLTQSNHKQAGMMKLSKVRIGRIQITKNQLQVLIS
jgi:ribosomal protein L7/L12